MDIILTRQRREKATALEIIKQTSVKKAIVLLPIIPRGLSFFCLPSLPPKWPSETLAEECVRLR